MGRIKRLLLKRQKAERENRRKKRQKKRREFVQKSIKFLKNKLTGVKNLVFQKEFLLAVLIFINNYITSQELRKLNAKLQEHQVEIIRLKMKSKLEKQMEESWYSRIDWPTVLFFGYTIYTKLYNQEEYIVEEPKVEEPKKETANKLTLPYHPFGSVKLEKSILFTASERWEYLDVKRLK